MKKYIATFGKTTGRQRRAIREQLGGKLGRDILDDEWEGSQGHIWRFYNRRLVRFDKRMEHYKQRVHLP